MNILLKLSKEPNFPGFYFLQRLHGDRVISILSQNTIERLTIIASRLKLAVYFNSNSAISSFNFKIETDNGASVKETE
jgi:hypothetical protein